MKNDSSVGATLIKGSPISPRPAAKAAHPHPAGAGVMRSTVVFWRAHYGRPSPSDEAVLVTAT